MRTRGGVREGPAGRAQTAGRGVQTCLLRQWAGTGGFEHKDALDEKEKRILSAALLDKTFVKPPNEVRETSAEQHPGRRRSEDLGRRWPAREESTEAGV